MPVVAALNNREMFASRKAYSVESGLFAKRQEMDVDITFKIEDFSSYSSEEEITSEEAVQTVAVVAQLREGMNALPRVLSTIEKFQGKVVHVETRPSKQSPLQFDLLLKIELREESVVGLLPALRKLSGLAGVEKLVEEEKKEEMMWFPRHASELDKCNKLMTKFDVALDMNHPGFADKEYRARREHIVATAFEYKYGDAIAHIEYSESENATWRAVFNTVVDLAEKHACAEYRRAFAKLQAEGIFTEHKIPQLETMSRFMQRETGFTLRPAAGLLTARDFLASLAFRVFQSTQYVRHVASPYHTPEPDCIHEILGHMPLLADASFAQFSQEIGLASLGASDAEIEKLSTVYWFTVEFGLCREAGEVKAYGAGLLSSYGELLHALSDKPELRAFEPSATALQPYQDQDYQPVYFVADSFTDAKDKFRRWVATMSRPFELRFNPHTARVEILDSVPQLQAVITQLNTEIQHLTNAINKLSTASS